MPLLYRDAPLNSIWEGSGNVAALDVLRAMVKEPEGLPAFLAECELAAGADRRLDAHLERTRASVDAAVRRRRGALAASQFEARRTRRGPRPRPPGLAARAPRPAAVADAFCAARLGGEGGRAYGTLPAAVDAQAIIERALPV